MSLEQPQKEKLGFISMAGYLKTMIAVLIICVADCMLAYFLDISFIYGLEPIGYLFLVAISSIFYKKNAKGGENIATAIILALSAYIIYIIVEFFFLVSIVISSGGDTRAISFLSYIVNGVFDSYYLFGAEINGIFAKVLHIITIMIMAFLYNSMFNSAKVALNKKKQTTAVQNDFLSRNLDSDMTNPFVQARMWTERGMIAKGMISVNQSTIQKEIEEIGERMNTYEEMKNNESVLETKEGEQQVSETVEKAPETLEDKSDVKAEKTLEKEDKDSLENLSPSDTKKDNAEESADGVPDKDDTSKDEKEDESEKKDTFSKVKEMWNTPSSDNNKEEEENNG